MEYVVNIEHSPNPTFTEVTVGRWEGQWVVSANTEGVTYSESFPTEANALSHLAELLTQVYLEHCQADPSYAKLVMEGTPLHQVPYLEAVELAFRIRSPNGITHTLYHGHGLESVRGGNVWWANQEIAGTFAEMLQYLITA